MINWSWGGESWEEWLVVIYEGYSEGREDSAVERYVPRELKVVRVVGRIEAKRWMSCAEECEVMEGVFD